MLRWLPTVLILCIMFGGIDAAADVESIGACDDRIAHEIHGELPHSPLDQDGSPDDPAPPAGEHAVHYCHCAVHAPALPPSTELTAAPSSQPSPSLPSHLCGTVPSPPPVRPPNLG